MTKREFAGSFDIPGSSRSPQRNAPQDNLPIPLMCVAMLVRRLYEANAKLASKHDNSDKGSS